MEETKTSDSPKPDPTTLPKIVIIKPPPVFTRLESEFSRHFHFLKAYESSLSLTDFLSAANSAGVTAMFSSAIGPPITGPTILDHIPSLRCIVSSAVGFDYIDLDECRRRGISVANSSGSSAPDCADFSVGLLIDVLRKVSAGNLYVRGGGWSGGVEFPLGIRLAGKTIGIVGLGSIGSKIAKRLEGFGCRILYSSREKKSSVLYPFYSDVCTLASDSDVLVIACSLTDYTRHMMGKEVLLALGKDGIIINIARGAIVDEKELLKFLLDGQIAGAGLDVFEHEPNLPKELVSLDNVVLSHHQAGFTNECFYDLFERIKANFEAFFSGKPLLSPVV